MELYKWDFLLLSLLLPQTFCHSIAPASVSNSAVPPGPPPASPAVVQTNPFYCPFVPQRPPPTSTGAPPVHPGLPFVASPPPPEVFFLGPPLYQPPVVFPPPARPPSAGHGFVLWCVAKPTVPDPIIQEAMNYACGSGADCTSIQPLGMCFEPNRLIAHASYAFNSYWQRTKAAGGTCDFGGTAMLVSVDPSYGGCRFNNY